MAYRDRGLIIDSLGHSASNYTTGANVTVSASLSPSSSGTRMMLTNIGWSIRNAGAAAYTATMNVRDSSINGAVRESWDMIVTAGASLQDSYVTNIKGLRGQALNVDFGPPAASVTVKVSAVGWEERSEGN